MEAWIADHPVEPVFLGGGEAELRYGAAIMPTGRRRETPFWISRRCWRAFENRILPFDSRAARAYAVIAAKRRAGRAVAPTVCQIAAIARVARYGGGDAKRSGFRGDGDRCIQPMERHMSRTTQAFARVKIDALQRVAGWELTRGEHPFRTRTAERHSVRLRPLWTGPGVLWRHLKPSVPAPTPCGADQGHSG